MGGYTKQHITAMQVDDDNCAGRSDGVKGGAATADITSNVTGMEYLTMDEIKKEIIRYREELSGMCEEFDALMENQSGVWVGVAQKEFAISYDKLRPKLRQVDELLQRYISGVQEVTQRQQEVEQENAMRFCSQGNSLSL